jgi:hypothetical protein
MRERFDLEALDPDDPFELDSGNLPHLTKHAPLTAEDALDGGATVTRSSIPRPRKGRPTG